MHWLYKYQVEADLAWRHSKVPGVEGWTCEVMNLLGYIEKKAQCCACPSLSYLFCDKILMIRFFNSGICDTDSVVRSSMNNEILLIGQCLLFIIFSSK